jgi:hypothetical protein
MSIHAPKEAISALTTSTAPDPTLFFNGVIYEVQSAARHVAPTEGFYPILTLEALSDYCSGVLSESALADAVFWLVQNQEQWLSVAMENGLD